VGFGLSPLLVFVQLGLKPGYHQQPLRVYNSIASAFLVVGSGSAACHPHEHQQRRSVGCGLSPLLVFVQLALRPGFHQQHLRDVQFYCQRFSGCWWRLRCLPSPRTPTTAVSGLRTFAVVGVRAVGLEAGLSPTTLAGWTPLLVFVQLALKPGFHRQHLRVYNSIASAFLVVGGGSAACHLHEHQQRRSVGFGLSPLLVFVQLALRPGFHQQHLPGVQFYCQRFSGCWCRLRCLPSPRTPTTAVSGLRAFAVGGVRAVGFEAGLSPTTLAGVRRCWCSCSWL